MAKIKLLTDVDVVWWAETIQADAEVDGEKVTFRYHENSNGTEHYIYDQDRGWIQDYDDKFDCLFDVCGQLEINKDSKVDEEFDTEEE
jgi:hypothetical protein